MDLKQPLAQGATVPTTLRFEDAKRVSSTRDVQVPVGAPEGAAARAGQVH